MYFWNIVLRLCNLKIANMRDNIMVTVPITLRVDYSTAAHQDGSFFIPRKVLLYGNKYKATDNN